MYNRICAIGLTLAVALPVAASAQQSMPPYRQGSWEITLSGGAQFTDGSLRDFLSSGTAGTRFTNTTDPQALTPTAVARVGYNISRNFGVSVSGAAAWGAGVRHLVPAVSLTYTRDINARTSPFVMIGTELTRLNGQNGRVTHSTWGFHAGLGVRRMLNDNLALRLEGQMRFEGYDETPMSRRQAYTPVVTLGLSYFLGGRSPQVATVMYPRPRIDTVIQVRRDTVVRTRRDTVVVQAPETDQLVLRVQFQTNLTSLLPQSLPVLDTIAMAIIATPGSRWEVQGHTDSVGSAEDNRILGQGRAQAVVDYLVTRGVDRSILTARGFGQDRPVFSNTTLAGRAQNRRVQLRRIPDPPTGRPVP
jgi:outer membrane protein OmpA-like peptidoglycan-associated protein